MKHQTWKYFCTSIPTGASSMFINKKLFPTFKPLQAKSVPFTGTYFIN